MVEGADEIGTVATAGLAAREVDRAQGGGHGARGNDAPCANCGTALVGDYCHACGQAGHVHRTAGALFHDIGHGVFHFEGKVWRTLPLLAWKPGELTRRYVEGERVRFVSPMALFLFSVFLMFASLTLVTPKVNLGELGAETGALARQVSAEHDAAIKRVAREQGALDLAISGGENEATVLQRRSALAEAKKTERNLAAARAAVGAGEQTRGGRINSGSAELDAKVEHAIDNPELSLYKLKTAAYKYSWALIPISVPFIWLLFPFRRRTGLYDHAVFATYSLSFMTLLVVVASAVAWTGIDPTPIWIALTCIPPLHMYRQIRGAYGVGRWGAAIRTLLLLFFTIFTTLMFALLLLYLGLA